MENSEKLDNYSKLTTAIFCINFMANVARNAIDETDDLYKFTPRLPHKVHDLEEKVEELAEEMSQIAMKMAHTLHLADSFDPIDRRILQPAMDALNAK